MRRMVHPTLKLMLLLLMLLGLVSILVNASSIQSDFGHCDRVVKRWAFSSLDQEIKEDRHTLRDLLFFLHVPRTGGRTYFHCFLKKLYSNNLECPRSYDKLRFDPSKTKCRLLVTHDDYSMMSKLPNQRTSVVTILRNPVDRVFSTYEFSIEVAARFLLHPNLSSAIQMSGRVRSKTKGVSTLDIWPWKYLVPWMREDLFARRDARIQKGSRDIKSNFSYDIEDIVMPLHKYINDPVAHDIIHNGATFQVAGLTNNSYLAESHEVRHCVQKYRILGDHVLQVAKVISQLRASNTSMKSVSNKKSEQSPSILDSDPDNNDHQNSSSDQNAGQLASNEDGEAMKENMTVEDLMEAYEGCISSLRKTQAARRTASLKRISPANFSKEERLQVPEMLLEQIRSLNHLDLELYKYAQEIFEKRHKHTMEKLITAEMWESMFNNSYGGVFWKVFPLVMTIILLFCLFVLFVNARRRTSKVKI
ncbi:hypothetical protein RGQ29_031889 [Quercus rubra]|uniref:Sulfotransferase n=1 Tax=Quercus rubra TaxID=3512 RepID=A0AAN7I5E8_QUERU|nr:hypothetical protein RGQ29_031889 [Quercus rubra]